MASANRKAASIGAACVQGLTVPDWVRKAMGSRIGGPPPGALTVEELAKVLGLSRGHANFVLKEKFEAGNIDRVTLGGKFYYFEKK